MTTPASANSDAAAQLDGIRPVQQAGAAFIELLAASAATAPPVALSGTLGPL